jgi:hypothetical protein
VSINANVTGQPQIQATVGETKIDVAVSGGFGPSGNAGAAGQAASITVGTVTTGAPGSSASVVNAGTSSAAVLNFTIPAGATGAQGIQGEPGVAGAAGAKGDKGDKGDAGDQGPAGAKGDKGDQGDAGPAGAAGATGAKGDKGDKGDTGDTGPQGPSGVVTATAPVTYNAGTQTVALSIGAGLSTSSGSLVLAGHKASHATGGTDALTPADIGAASALHAHSASDVTSGTLDIARLPVGTGSTQVAAGNDARFSDARTPTSHASSHQIGGSDALTNVVDSPSQITSNQNDYSLPSADVVRLSSDAARDITGFAAGSSGQVIVLVNVGSFAITLRHQSTSSTAANRVVVPWAADYILDPSYAAVLLYDATASRWRVV